MKFFQATKLTAAVVLSGIAMFVSAATSADESTSSETQAKFRQLDADHDGFISRSESRRLRSFDKAFDEADENHDGKLSPDEFAKAEPIYQRQQVAMYVDDSMITAKVKAALLKEAQLKSLDVSVQTYHGQVLLSGFVDDDKQRTKALMVAATVAGVVTVKDGLTVK